MQPLRAALRSSRAVELQPVAVVLMLVSVVSTGASCQTILPPSSRHNGPKLLVNFPWHKQRAPNKLSSDNTSPHHKSWPSSSSGFWLSSILFDPAEVEDNSALLPEVAIFARFVNRSGVGAPGC